MEMPKLHGELEMDQNDADVKEWLNSLGFLKNTFMDFMVNGGIALGLVLGAITGLYVNGSHGTLFGLLAGLGVGGVTIAGFIGMGFFISDKWFVAWRNKKYGIKGNGDC